MTSVSRRAKLIMGLLGISMLIPPATALAQQDQAATNEPEACAPAETRTDKYRHLRALSLDLRGVPPTTEEYAALADHDDVPEALIDEWLGSKEFAARTVRWHRGLLWNNITNHNMVSVNRGLTVSSQTYWRNGTMAIRLRGRNVPCLNEPAKLVGGEQISSPMDLTRGELLMQEQADGSKREGWVMVEPYWAPGTQVKVCALDAREDAATSSGSPCNARLTQGDVECGCGPNMIWCAPGSVQTEIKRAMGDQLDKIVEWMVLERRPYIELFTTNKTFFNGPLVYYWKHLWSLGSNVVNEPNPLQQDYLPNLSFDQGDTWVESLAGQHAAGILTTPAYLIRFQTDRARATQFFTKFRCQPFQPPNDGLKLTNDQHPDLQQREGCKYCHALLEPASSYWGRWREQSAGYLWPQQFPAISDACKTCAQTGRGCSADCRTHYVMNTTESQMMPYAGHLNAYLFRKPEHEVNVEQGPALLALSSVADNSLLSCLVQKSAETYYGRPTVGAEREWMDQTIREFSDKSFDYASIIKRIVTSETYRRVQ